MNINLLSRFENRKLRRTIILFTGFPPLITAIISPFIGLSLDVGITLMLSAVIMLLGFLLDYTVETDLKQRRRTVVFASDEEQLMHAIDYVQQNRPKTLDLIEYSGVGATKLIAAFASNSSAKRIRLLVCHPDSAISSYQRDIRLIEGLRDLAYRVDRPLAIRCKLEVRCYREPASLRGRLIDDDLLTVGWYSYDDRGMPDTDGAQMSGASNPSVLFESMDQDGANQILRFFSRVFENKWKKAETLDRAWANHHSRAGLLKLVPKEWMETVSVDRGRC